MCHIEAGAESPLGSGRPTPPPFPHHDAHPGESGGRAHTHPNTLTAPLLSQVGGFQREATPVGEDLCPRRFRRANCVRSGAGAPGSGTPERVAPRGDAGVREPGSGQAPRARNWEDTRGGGGTRSARGDSPGHVGSGQPPPPPPAPPPALSSSAFAPRHGRAARARSSRRLRAAKSLPRSPPARCRRPALARPAQSRAGKCRRVSE